MMIMNHAPGDRDLSHLAINLVIRPGEAFLDCGRVSDDLERGARLVRILERSIRPALFGIARWLVGIESWSISEGQNGTAQQPQTVPARRGIESSGRWSELRSDRDAVESRNFRRPGVGHRSPDTTCRIRREFGRYKTARLRRVPLHQCLQSPARGPPASHLDKSASALCENKYLPGSAHSVWRQRPRRGASRSKRTSYLSLSLLLNDRRVRHGQGWSLRQFAGQHPGGFRFRRDRQRKIPYRRCARVLVHADRATVRGWAWSQPSQVVVCAHARRDHHAV